MWLNLELARSWRQFCDLYARVFPTWHDKRVFFKYGCILIMYFWLGFGKHWERFVSILAHAQFIVLTTAQSSLIDDRASIENFLNLLHFGHLRFVMKCNALSVRVKYAGFDIYVPLNVQLLLGVSSVQNSWWNPNFFFQVFRIQWRHVECILALFSGIMVLRSLVFTWSRYPRPILRSLLWSYFMVLLQILAGRSFNSRLGRNDHFGQLLLIHRVDINQGSIICICRLLIFVRLTIIIKIQHSALPFNGLGTASWLYRSA